MFCKFSFLCYFMGYLNNSSSIIYFSLVSSFFTLIPFVIWMIPLSLTIYNLFGLIILFSLSIISLSHIADLSPFFCKCIIMSKTNFAIYRIFCVSISHFLTLISPFFFFFIFHQPMLRKQSWVNYYRPQAFFRRNLVRF